MKRWDTNDMQAAGETLFASIYKRKWHAHYNHDVHDLGRSIKEWLPAGIKALQNGTYNPRPLKRLYFEDEVVDQLYLADRVFQHILLKQLKATFKHVMNKNCYHLLGPTGVKYATEHIRQALEEDQPQYVIRADIKSFYKSIPHYKLIQDIKQHYHDPHLQAMLIEIIKNPIETARGEKNDDTGIALRGPLSQFFSALYLKPLDDAMSKMDVTYIRYQDDWVVLCKTKRQFQRCWKTMLDVLHERRLPLSRQKTRKGKVSEGFHFLGVSYLPTQPVNNTTAVPVDPDMDDQNPDKSGGG